MNGWERIENRRVGRNISVIYRKKNITVQLFRDSMWGETDEMNVIVRDKRKKTIESSLGKSIDVYHGKSEKDAMEWASRYMRNN